MKAILINDTRSDHHIGCELVIRNTLKACERHGIQITTTITTENSLQAPQLIIPLLKKNDLILLNGEGTLHDDRSRALALLQTIHLAKKHGLKTVLYNALWTNNSIGLKYIPDFNLIFCRDSASTHEILTHYSKAPVKTVLDMIFATSLNFTLDIESNRKKTAFITDAVKKGKSIPLANFAAKNNLPFSPMGADFYRSIKSSPVLRWKLKHKSNYKHNQLDTVETYIHNIRHSSGLISGRFHASCLALLLETPVYSITSNTQKIENLYTDLGLSPNLVSHSINSLEDATKQWQEQTNQRQKINKHISKARQKIDRMFKKIAQL